MAAAAVAPAAAAPAAAPAAAAPAAAAPAAAVNGPKCQASGCAKAAAQECPTCREMKLKPAHYCSAECFKKAWPEHKQVHADAKARAAYVAPKYAYSGSIRPHWVSPVRSVPAHIKKPDYYATGQPVSELEERNSAKIHINSPEEIVGIKAACKLGREVLDMAGHMVKPGVTTEEIDKAVHEMIVAHNAYPSPLNYHNFPKSCCTSVNEVVCHGIPDARPLEEGDIVNLDISVYLNGFHADLNETYPVGKVDDASKTLMKASHDSLMEAIKMAKPNVMVRDFGTVISKVVGKYGFSVVKTYCGHGIGRLFHGSPSIPHYARNKGVGVLKPGMCFTIEPMINAGTSSDKLWDFDDWTVTTTDGKRSAQFEHTILVTETGCEILTARTTNSVPFWWELPGAEAKAPAAAPGAAAAKPTSAPASSAAAGSSANGNGAGAAPAGAAASTAAPEAGAAPADGQAAAAKKKKKKKK